MENKYLEKNEKPDTTNENPEQELETKNQGEDSQQQNENQGLPSEEKNGLSDSIVNIQPYDTDLKQNEPVDEVSEYEKSDLAKSMVYVSPETEGNNYKEEQFTQPIVEVNSNSDSEAKNEENNTDLTESIVPINSLPHESDPKPENSEAEQSKTENSEQKLTESVDNFENMDFESKPGESADNQMIQSITDEVQNMQKENQLTESPVDMNPVHGNQEDPSSPPPPTDTTDFENEDNTHQKEDDITKSTFLLTQSQILTEPCAEVEKINEQGEKNQNNLNTESMIVTNLSSEASSYVTSPVTNDYVDENKTKQDDDENLDNEYEITDSIIKNEIDALSQEISSKLIQVQQNTQEDLKEALEKEPERVIENEKYEKILGSDALLKKILKYGDSSAGRPSNGQMVTVSYEAYLKDDPEKLVDHSDNLQFILGDGDVISAIDMVVSLMDKNELCEMITESRLAFGDLGKQPDIPPKADLVYKIELKDIRDLDEINKMNPVERLSLAEAKKMRGNFHFNRQDFLQATNAYKKGLKYFGEESLRGDESDQDLDKFLEISQALLMNTALAFFKQNELRQALESLEEVLKAQPSHIKGLYIKGKVLLQLGETEESVKSLSRAVQLDPNNSDIKKELLKAQAKHKIQYESEKKMYQKMMSGVTKNDEKKIVIKNNSNYTGYVAAGLAVAVASIGIALFARSKNIF